MEKVEVAVIGAGVVGLALAYELSRSRHGTIAVLERNATYGLETSSRNSQVIHSGIYYPSAMLKTRLCIDGKHKLYHFCDKYRLPHRRLGKMIVSANTDETEGLETLLQQGRNNGLEVRFLSSREIQVSEPSLKACAALYVPDSGIVDVHRLMQQLYLLSRGNEVIFNFHSELIGLEYTGHDYILQTNRDKFKAERIINSGGLCSDVIFSLLGQDVNACGYRLHPCKGEYYILKKSMHIHHLIYPLPDKSGTLGIHITPDLSGRLRLGPNAYEVSEIDYDMDYSYQDIFYQSARNFLPDLKRDDIAPDFAGIRPRLQQLSQPPRDFIINEESGRNFPHFINLIGIESPGLTSCLAIAAHVAGLVD